MSLHLVINQENKDKFTRKFRTIEELGPDLAEQQFKEQQRPFMRICHGHEPVGKALDRLLKIPEKVAQTAFQKRVKQQMAQNSQMRRQNWIVDQAQNTEFDNVYTNGAQDLPDQNHWPFRELDKSKPMHGRSQIFSETCLTSVARAALAEKRSKEAFNDLKIAHRSFDYNKSLRARNLDHENQALHRKKATEYQRLIADPTRKSIISFEPIDHKKTYHILERKPSPEKWQTKKGFRISQSKKDWKTVKVNTDLEPHQVKYREVGEFSRVRDKSREIHPEQGIIIPNTQKLLRESNQRYVSSMRKGSTNTALHSIIQQQRTRGIDADQLRTISPVAGPNDMAENDQIRVVQNATQYGKPLLTMDMKSSPLYKSQSLEEMHLECASVDSSNLGDELQYRSPVMQNPTPVQQITTPISQNEISMMNSTTQNHGFRKKYKSVYDNDSANLLFNQFILPLRP